MIKRDSKQNQQIYPKNQSILAFYCLLENFIDKQLQCFLILCFKKNSQKTGSLANVRTPMETYPIIANFILFFRGIPLERVKSGTLVYQLGRTRSIDIWGYQLRLLIYLMLKPLQGSPWPILIEAFIETHLLLKFKVRLKLYT